MPKGIRNPKPADAEPLVGSSVPPKPELIGLPVESAPLAVKVAALIEDLAVYASRIERQAQPFAVCKITHPNAVTGTVFDGIYSGIRLEQGAQMSAQLSNGTII